MSGAKIEVVAGARWCLPLAALLLGACTGRIGLPGGSEGEGQGDPVGGKGVTTPPGTPARDPNVAGYTPGEAGATDRPAPATRVTRLTHTQWANTVRDLFGLDAATTLAGEFRNDPAQQGFLFDNNATSLSVDGSLWASYQRAAADLAGQVVADGALLSRIAPASAGAGDARARAFIETFGQQMHRRPLTDAETSEYFAIYQGAAGAYGTLADFESGVRLVLEAFLQSPHFLYRVEQSSTQVGSVVPLDGWELASRLSYTLWNTMPDLELFRAARAGELSLADKVAEQAARLLGDPRAEDVIARFHEQLLNVEHYEVISPAPAFFPDAPAGLGDLAREETDRFVRSIVQGGGGFLQLLQSDKTYVNADLAAIYGLTGSYTNTFVEATLDPSQRRGLLTQVGFLASNATAVNPDPIHRGVFIAKRILCQHIAAPPANVPALPPAGNRTNRQTVEDHTQQADSVCITCHGTIINPLGFPFESFDALGAYRTTDQDQPVNTVSDPKIDGAAVHVDGAPALIDAIAGSTSAHECYAKHWLEFAYGRPEASIDETLVTRLGDGSRTGTLPVKELLLSLVKTESFLTRSVEELP